MTSVLSRVTLAMVALLAGSSRRVDRIRLLNSNKLGIARFALLGSSGGGPFALAMAAAVPERVSDIALLASPGNYAE
jgi:pimeloyl-ACP methyl ester carboxylesterase